eukprot:SAG11_NODE_6180_length_1370_cov_2.834776_2_plen_24_part_01
MRILTKGPSSFVVTELIFIKFSTL